MQVSGSNSAAKHAAEKAEEDRANTQGDYLRQRRMLAAQELANAGNKKVVNYKDDADSSRGGAGAGAGSDGRFGRFFNSFSGK